MKITKIQVQKKNKQRYSIFIDDQFAFGVAEPILIEFTLRKGQTLDQVLIQKILKAEFHYSFYQKTLNYLSYGLRSEKEVRDYLDKQIKQAQADEDQENLEPSTEQISLKNSGTSEKNSGNINFHDFEGAEDLIEQVICKLKDQHLLNDLMYGQAYVRTQASINRKGPQIIIYELKAKGLDPNIIESALLEYPKDLQRENLHILAEKFLKSKKRLPVLMQQNKLYHHLMQKGYDREIIQSFLADFQIDVDDELQEELLEQQARKSLKKRSRNYTGYDLKQHILADLRRKGFEYEMIQNWLADHEAERQWESESGEIND